MNRIILLLLVFIFSSLFSFSQDTIFKIDETIIISKITEIESQKLRYHEYTNPNGPVYTIKKKEINKIVLQNGRETIYNEQYGEKKDESIQMIFHMGIGLTTYKSETSIFDWKPSFTTGVSFDIPFGLSSSNFFNIAIQYDQKGASVINYGFEVDSTLFKVSGLKEKLNYLSLTASYKKYFTELDKFYGRAGIYSSYLFDASSKGTYISGATGEVKELELPLTDYYSSLDVGFIIGLGADIPLYQDKFKSSLVLEINYSRSLLDIKDVTDNSFSRGDDAYNSGFFFMAGLKFPF